MSRSAVDTLFYAACSSDEKAVLMVIAFHGRGTDGSGGYPSVRRIAKMAGVSRSTLHHVLTSLRAKGWLSWTSGSARDNTANTYTLHLDVIPMLADLTRLPRHPVSTLETPPVSEPDSTVETPPVSTPVSDVREPSKYLEANAKDTHTTIAPDGAVCVSTLFPQKKPLTPADYAKFWNSQIVETSLSAVSLPLSDKRVAKVRTRIGQGLTNVVFRQVVAKIKTSPFLMGDNPTNWRADFDWVMKNDTNFQRVLEGSYDKKAPPMMKPVTTIPSLLQQAAKAKPQSITDMPTIKESLGLK